MTELTSAINSTSDDNQIMAERRAKLAALRAVGVAYPNDFKRKDFAADVIAAYDAFDKPSLAEKNIDVTVAGRIMLKRVMGKATFLTIQDMSGRLQLYIALQAIDETTYEALKHWDLGDIVGAQGTVFKTNKGELSVHVHQIRLLSKALRPLPEKFHGLTDTEQKYRQRYLDLITNQASRVTFIKRSKIVQGIRAFMVARGYLEVETPMMHPIPGGATAKPFTTHHNALDMPLFLRIAPELYLKRLVVGGMEKVFEINRNFRNEGISTRHNPEFTMMEFYEAYCDYRDMMDTTEAILRTMAQEVCGSAKVNYQGQLVDLEKPFDRLTMTQAICQYNTEYTVEQLENRDFLVEKLTAWKAKFNPNAGLGALQLVFFEETTETKLWHPTFIIDYPAEVSPLARQNDTNPTQTERFELFITGRELANGYSELNDPEDQAQRFLEQVKQKDAGDDEAMHFDADYIRALEYGLPPTGGCGIGIDRLVMLLTDSPSIRDVVLFPQLRRED